MGRLVNVFKGNVRELKALIKRQCELKLCLDFKIECTVDIHPHKLPQLKEQMNELLEKMLEEAKKDLELKDSMTYDLKVKANIDGEEYNKDLVSKSNIIKEYRV